MKLGIFEIQKGSKEGFELLAPVSYWNASQKEINEKTGGCGPGKIGDWFIPDSILGDSIFLACQIHDWMYDEGQSIYDKKWADILLDVNIKLLILSTETKTDAARIKIAVDYFIAVYFGGKEAFEKGKTPTTNQI
jgi:hypothetical protein